MLNVTYYLEVISSWCHWAEPAWAQLKQQYAGKAEFQWKIALMPPEAYPVSKAQCEWFYRRSGSVMRSPYMLNAGWFEPEIRQYLVPNLLAQAAKQLGAKDDRVRLALAHAAMRDGKSVGCWEVATPIAAEAAGIEQAKLRYAAEGPEVAAITQATTAEFFALQVKQRPAFLIENSIGDRAVFSGIVRAEPITAAMEALLSDETAYNSWKAHFGDPPPS